MPRNTIIDVQLVANGASRQVEIDVLKSNQRVITANNSCCPYKYIRWRLLCLSTGQPQVHRVRKTINLVSCNFAKCSSILARQPTSLSTLCIPLSLPVYTQPCILIILYSFSQVVKYQSAVCSVCSHFIWRPQLQRCGS